MGTDLDGAASGLSAAGLQASSRSKALSRLQCSGQHLGPEVLASARGWQTPQAVAREAVQAAETGRDPTCPAQHPIPPSRRWLDKYCELLGKLGSGGLAWGSWSESQVGWEELGGCRQGRPHSGALGTAGERGRQQLLGARLPRRGIAVGGGVGGTGKGKG